MNNGVLRVDYNKMKNFFESKKYLCNFLKNGSVRAVSSVPILLAIFLLAIWVLLRRTLLIEVQTIYNYLILSIACFLVGATGIVYIYKREMPGYTSSTTIKGVWAVISGLIIIIFPWALGILIMVFALT